MQRILVCRIHAQWLGVGGDPDEQLKLGEVVDVTVPLPNRRTVLGGPLNAEKRRVIRPFSRTCDTVSMPVAH